ncbi:MAG: hypothetical protein FWF24_02350 [Alphaproteobacteria bacterium]|nr:hypothetical protein [Alphaproteobacteria bacterium]
MNQSIRLLGRIWSWLIVQQPVEKYTARLVAEVGPGNGPEAINGAIFEGEDGRVFYASVISIDINEGYVREILPKDFSPALIAALDGKFIEHEKGWILHAPVSREPFSEIKLITDPTITAALKWAYNPYPKVEERPYRPPTPEEEAYDKELGRACWQGILKKCCPNFSICG